MRRSIDTRRSNPNRPWIVVAFLSLVIVHTPLQAIPPIYRGTPFVPIIQSHVFLEGIGFTIDFVSAEFTPAGLTILPLNPQAMTRMIITSSGGVPSSALTFPNETNGIGGSIQQIGNPGSARGLSHSIPFAGETADGPPLLLSYSQGRVVVHVSPETAVPGYPNRHFDEITHPILAHGQIAFFGRSGRPGQSPVSGIYLVREGQITSVIDTRILEVSSTRFDFDGEQIVFVANSPTATLYSYDPDHGIRPFTTSIRQDEGSVQLVADWMSAPSLSGQRLVIGARMETGEPVLIQYADRQPAVILRAGMRLNQAETLTDIDYASAIARSTKTYFESKTSLGQLGIFVINEGIVSRVIDNSSPLVGDQLASDIQLMDVEEDQVSIKVLTGDIFSLHATLPAPEIPLIFSIPPSPILVSQGAPLEIVTESAGQTPLEYIWQKNGLVIPNQQRPRLTIQQATAAESGTYHLTVSNAYGTDTATVQVSVATSPLLDPSPADQTLFAGESLFLSIAAAGSIPLRYQWYKDGELLVDHGSQVLGIPQVQSSDAGIYQLRVSNALGDAASRPIQIQVRPIPPNPVFEGGQFNPLLTLGASLPGDPDAGQLIAFQVYPSGEAVVASTRYAQHPNRDTILKLTPSEPARVLFNSETLGDQLEQDFDDLRDLRFDFATRTLTFTATIEGVPVGMYRFGGENFETLVEPDSPVPDAPLQSYRDFRTEHSFYGETIFAATLNRTDTRGIYQHTSARISILANESTLLPEGFGKGDRTRFLASNGFEHLYQKTTPSVPHDLGLFLHREAGPTLLLRRNDALPQVPNRFYQCIAAESTNARFFLMLQSTDFETSIYSYRASAFQRLVSTGDSDSEGNQIVSIAPQQPHFENGRLYFQATIIPVPDGVTTQGPRPAILFWDENGLHPVLTTERLSGQLITELEINHVFGHTVFVTATLQRQGRTLFANRAPAQTPPPRLSFSPTPAGIRLEVPEAYQLERKDSLDAAVWHPLPGAQSIDIPTDQSQALFRLRKR